MGRKGFHFMRHLPTGLRRDFLAVVESTCAPFSTLPLTMIISVIIFWSQNVKVGAMVLPCMFFRFITAVKMKVNSYRTVCGCAFVVVRE